MDTAPSLTHDLAQGFAEHVRQWSLEAGAAEEDAQLAARAARALSLAVSEGHVCLRLDELDDGALLRERLPTSRIAGTPHAPGVCPLILDGQRLYLHRWFDFERRLARRLARARAAVPEPVTPKALALLRELFAPSDDNRDRGAVDWQQVAAALALRGALTVVSGAPGTGKTSTVARLLGCLLAQRPGSRIALAAPTGKAAARLAQAVREQAQALPAELRARLPREASTVHRLLGSPSGLDGGRFKHRAGRLLPVDVLVVDEASMLSLPMAARLLEAVPEGARIVLLGDKDQLAAVEGGAVFAEISADASLSPPRARELAALCGVAVEKLVPPAPLARTGLADHVVWLQRPFRFGPRSPLGRLAQAVHLGDARQALALLREAQHEAAGALCWLPQADELLSDEARQRLLQGYAPFVDTLRRDAADVAAVAAAFERFRVLAALREGSRGVAALNALVAAQVREAVQAAPSAPWYAGRAVLVTRNDEATRLFNGDVGIALPASARAGGGALQVFFADEAGFRALPPARLPPHQDAFAMTVHRAQGSELEEAMLVLPAAPVPVLSRELLYTGLTRARRRVTLAGSATVVASAIHAPTRRHSGLLARLAEEMGTGEAGGTSELAGISGSSSPGAPMDP